MPCPVQDSPARRGRTSENPRRFRSAVTKNGSKYADNQEDDPTFVNLWESVEDGDVRKVSSVRVRTRPLAVLLLLVSACLSYALVSARIAKESGIELLSIASHTGADGNLQPVSFHHYHLGKHTRTLHAYHP